MDPHPREHEHEHDHNQQHDHDQPGRSFDDRAATWDDDPGKAERARQVAASIRQAVPLRRDMRVLEVGAGTGLLTQALLDDIGPATLTDTSAGMREVMRQKVQGGALPGAHVWDLDLAAGPVPDDRFDLVVSLMAFHHVPDVDALLANLATVLDPGGRLAVVDLDAEDGSFHGEGFEGHRGFERSAFAAQLRAAGFVDVSVQDCHDVQRDDGTYPLFLAVATAPTGSALA